MLMGQCTVYKDCVLLECMQRVTSNPYHLSKAGCQSLYLIAFSKFSVCRIQYSATENIWILNKTHFVPLNNKLLTLLLMVSLLSLARQKYQPVRLIRKSNWFVKDPVHGPRSMSKVANYQAILPSGINDLIVHSSNACCWLGW